jgi:predicted TIM-barrel fold metal-dependent hydrolase
MLDYFDCNAILGQVPKPSPGGILDAEGLLSEMDRYGIREALVYHAFARRNAPERGNRLTSEAASRSPRLHPCWMVLPTGTGEMPAFDDLARMMLQDGVRAVRMAPDAAGHMFSLTRAVCGDLFEWLEAHRLPVLLEQTAVAWRDVDEILERYPELPVVLIDVTYRINRDLYPRLAAYPGLGVEISYLQQHRGIEDICERFGPERLFFGTKIPLLCPGSARHMVETAPIPDEAKAAIAGGNLRGLLAAVPW